MKLLIAVVSFLLIGSIGAEGENRSTQSVEGTCSATVNKACGSTPTQPGFILKCSSEYGGIGGVSSNLEDYVSQQIVASYDYLILTTFFNSYQRNRPGFVKLFRSLSDRSFDDSIKLIKHITLRGSKVDFDKQRKLTNTADAETLAEGKVYEVNELEALGKVLDIEKKLSNEAFEIHRDVSRTHALEIKHPEGLNKGCDPKKSNHPSCRVHVEADRRSYDAEISQFLEEEFLGKQAETVRKLSGYANDLWRIVKDPNAKNPTLGIYLFDQYLQKQ